MLSTGSTRTHVSKFARHPSLYVAFGGGCRFVLRGGFLSWRFSHGGVLDGAALTAVYLIFVSFASAGWSVGQMVLLSAGGRSYAVEVPGAEVMDPRPLPLLQVPATPDGVVSNPLATPARGRRRRGRRQRRAHAAAA